MTTFHLMNLNKNIYAAALVFISNFVLQMIEVLENEGHVIALST